MPSSPKNTKEKSKRMPKSVSKAPAASSVADESANAPAMRIAKHLARVGLCSRREAERWIEQGRVRLNGKLLDTPAVTVSPKDRIEVDGEPLPMMERTRLWLFNKPSGQVTTNHDPEGRTTVFERLPETLPRVLSVGRLDINTEGLLLLTNDGGLARALELPSTGWLRRYRVRAHGKVTQEQLDELENGIAVDGVLYGSIQAELERQQGTNVWLTFAMREGKNREVKKVLAALDLDVNRLIRISYGPFQLGDLESGQVREVRGKTLRDQLGAKLVRDSGANFDAPLHDKTNVSASLSKGSPGRKSAKQNSRKKIDPLSRLDTKPGSRSTGKLKREVGQEREGARSRNGKARSKPSPKGRGSADRRR